jgi:small subunit ribosomal protein S29
VLSNTNAIPVADLPVWDRSTMSDEKYIGQMMALEGELLDQLRDSSAFKRTQGWELFRRPSVLVREETVDIATDILEIEEEGEGKMIKYLVAGEAGAGKSMMVLQAMSLAFMNRWIVLNIPEGEPVETGTVSESD